MALQKGIFVICWLQSFTGLTWQKVTRVLLMTGIMYICTNSMYIISASQDPALPLLRQAWLHLIPIVLSVFKEICIEISVHIIDSNFKRIIRTSDHPWKLQITSTLIFQRVFVLPLKGINICLWGHFIVQMVVKSVLWHQPYMFSVQALVQLNRDDFRDMGSKEGRKEQPVVKGHMHASCKITQQIKYEPVQTPHSQASFLCDSPSQTGITLMGGKRRS